LLAYDGKGNGVSPEDSFKGNTFEIIGSDLPPLDEKKRSRGVDSKKILLKMLDGTMITGRTNLRSNTRLSDLLNRQEDLFIVLFDAPFRGHDGQVVFVNKTQIMWAMPAEE
jgi:hypothetical protein